MAIVKILKENGEMVAAGDATQDIYSTGAKTNFDEPNALKAMVFLQDGENLAHLIVYLMTMSP